MEKLGVLVVEDDPADARLLTAVLAALPTPVGDVEVASSLAAALELLEARAFGLILLDLNLPDSRGLATVEALVANARDAAIIVCTGHDGEGLGILAVRAGAQDCIPKSNLEPEFLEKTISHAAMRRDLALERRKSGEEQMRILEEAAAFKATLLSTVAHELRTPLTPIRTELSMLLKDQMGPINDEQRESLELVVASAKRMSRLVDDLLDVARLQSGGEIQLQRAKLELTDVVNSTVRSFQTTAQDKSIKLQVGELAEVQVDADPDRISQVLANVVNNALKFTPNGGTVTIETSHKHRLAIIAVRDTGAGIPPEKLDKLFQPFSRLHQDEGLKVPGTGLGLSICKGLVEAHGGSIWAESAGRGKGTTFKISLPAAAPRKQAPEAEDEASSAASQVA